MRPLRSIERIVSPRKGLGRLYSPDPRDRPFTMERAIRAMPKADQKRRTQAPRRGPTLDQGPTPKCVMYSAATSLGAAPVTYKKDPLTIVKTPVDDPLIGPAGIAVSYEDLYEYAQAHDEWPGEDYEGTSVRAGQDYLIAIGRSSNYVWARNLEEAKDYNSRVGSAPIIIGIDWWSGMDNLKLIKGKYYAEPTGEVVGGHALCSLWFDRAVKGWKDQQTWGPTFGDDGIFYIPDDAFDYLVFQTNGEAVSYTELPLARA